MRYRLVFISLLLLLFLVIAPTALASSTWYVDGVHGKNKNDCKSPQTACKTIGHAISLAHSGDSIMVAAATYTENLTIPFSLKVLGSGALTTIIDGGRVNSVVIILAAAHVTLSNLTIRNGAAVRGGGINTTGTLAINNGIITGNLSTGAFTGTRGGGGIFNNGALTINTSTISGNIAANKGGAANQGGGIFNNDALTINTSTISGNIAGADGGGIFNDGGRGLTINNSTVGGNRAAHIAGGIHNYFSRTVRINNSTFSGNSAIGGGGIVNDGTATLQNSIVANNSANCTGFNPTSNGYNLSSDNTCDFDNTGDLNNTDPKLGQLGNYGGPTQTIPLLRGSPAIDAGNPNGCTDGNGHLLKTDQRGKPRPDKEDKSGCDMGAYERQKD